MKLSSILLVFATIISTSCGTPPAEQFPQNNFHPSQIGEPQLGAPYTEIAAQEIRTANCDGTNPTTTVSRSLVQEQTTFFEVAVEAGGLVRGTPIPTILEGELEAKIRAALGSSLGNKFEQSISTVLETQAGKAWKHKILWNETKVKGVIDLVYQDGTATLNFEKVIGIELFDRTSEPVPCEGQNGNPVPLPTDTEPSASTIPPTSSSSACLSSHLGAGKGFDITLINDCYYHLNVACDGCVADQENNYVVHYVGSSVQVTVPEGSVWQFSSEPGVDNFSSDCAPSAIDFWPSELPSFLNMSGVRQIWPCGVRASTQGNGGITQPQNSCAALPVNAQDDVDVSLSASSWYMVEDFDNSVSPPVHRFLARSGPGSVVANAVTGKRAWLCPSQDAAISTALFSANQYKQEHGGDLVYGPNGEEVR